MNKYLFLIFLIVSCTPDQKPALMQDIRFIKQPEKIYISPLLNSANFESLPYWPSNSEDQKLLINYLNLFWTKLNLEFLRQEQKSNFKLVKDTEHPTIRISVTILSSSVANDTLWMPVQVRYEHINDEITKEFSIATPIISRSSIGISRTHHQKHFRSFYRHFNYSSVVEFFNQNR